MNSLLVRGAWVIDILFFALLAVGTLLGVKKGFVAGVCKLMGTLLAIFIGIAFCVPMQASLEKNFGATTALNNAIAPPFGQWILVAICFIFLVVIVKLGCWLIGLIVNSVANRSTVVRVINMVLGGLLGAFEMFMLIFAILAILRWIPSTQLHNFLSSSVVAGSMFNSQWFINATSLSFKFK